MYYFNCLILIKFILFSCVVGIINVESRHNNETDLEDKINHKLYRFEANLLDRFIAYVDNKVNLLNINIEQKVTEVLSESNKKLEDKIMQRFNLTLDESIKSLEENMTARFNTTLDASNKNLELNRIQQLDSIKKEVLGDILPQLPCKERFVHGHYNSPSVLISRDSLNHGILRRNATGYITYFEMHFAIQAEPAVCIWLQDKERFEDSDIRYVICLQWNRESKSYLSQDINYHSVFRNGHTEILSVETPNLLSATDFQAFYIKIDNGSLEFSKEGDSNPIFIHRNDTNIGLFNYFNFRYVPMGVKVGKFRYDCPDPFKY